MKIYFVAFIAAAALTVAIGCQTDNENPVAGGSSTTPAVATDQGDSLTLVNLKLPQVSWGTKTSSVRALTSIDGLTEIEVDCTKKVAKFRLKDPDFDYTTAINELVDETPALAGWSAE